MLQDKLGDRVMIKLIILTATFNKAEYLAVLYKSLSKQEYQDFLWVIVNDGSTDGTDSTIKGFISEKKLNIEYIKQKNGGKSRATNVGIEKIKQNTVGNFFVLIVDDDEKLYPNALRIVNEQMKQYMDNSNIGSVLFRRIDKKTGKVLGNRIPNKILLLNHYTFMKNRYYCDGYIGYFYRALINFKFPEFENEKYIGPTVLILLVSQKYNVLYSDIVLGETEYLPGGITSQSRTLRLKNPKGMILRCVLLQDKRAGIINRLKYSIMGFAYMKLAGLTATEFVAEGIKVGKFIKICKIPAFLLALFWRRHIYKKNGK